MAAEKDTNIFKSTLMSTTVSLCILGHDHIGFSSSH